MQVFCTHESPTALEADALVVGVYTDGLSAAAEAIDRVTGGAITRMLELGEFKPEICKGFPLYLPPGVKAPLVYVVGWGPRDTIDRGAVFRIHAFASRTLSERPRRKVAYFADPAWGPDQQEDAVAGALVGCLGAGLYLSEPKRFEPQQICWSGIEPDAAGRGQIVGDAINLTRRLVNEPPSVIYPESFAARATEVARADRLEIEVWDEARLRQERCGALLAVAEGSARPPRLVILRYQGIDSQAPWMAWVGKGVTFDSGGLSLKPTDGMLTMKCDMAGGATVLGAMQAIARLQLPVNVLGLIGLVENMPGSRAFKLGDVLTSRQGKTIEVHNTDAEGRLVLADVLNVAVERGAEKIVDLATLTGACMVALGTDVAGLLGNHATWSDQVKDAADRCGERLWPLPMFPEYSEQIKSPIADIKNVGEGRWGGAITAAKFLEEFVAQRPWVHLDIAGPAYMEKPKPWLDAGGSGIFVRTLVELARRQA